MKILERLSDGIGTGEIRCIYEAGDGKHFCTRCNKLIRVEQEVICRWQPMAFRRKTQYRYTHINCSNSTNGLKS